MADVLTRAIGKLPKVEIHLHLEGAIPLDALWQLIEKYGRTAEVGDIEALTRKFQYRDFPHFIETWTWKNEFLREYEDFTFVAAAVAEDLAAQNIRYVEAFHSPGDFHMAHGLEIARITEAVRKGVDRHRDRVEIALIADLTRDYGPERGMRWLDELAEVKTEELIGIGIGGSEQAHPPEPYAEVYRRARELGFRTTAHAGEAAGASSVRGALEALEVDRIGHGTRAAEDPRLVEQLAEHRIPVEMCPISNLRTAVVESLEAHPIREFFERGLLVSVNTDDPKMFNTSLEEEYQALAETFGFGLSEISRLIGNAIDSSWCDSARKASLRAELEAAVMEFQT